MAFYIRKSARFGPFRLNFSKRGVGVSAGVKGLRIGHNRHGTYLQGGHGGLYFREQLTSARAKPKSKTAAQHTAVKSPPPAASIDDAGAAPRPAAARLDLSFDAYLRTPSSWPALWVLMAGADLVAMLLSNTAALFLAVTATAGLGAINYIWRPKTVRFALEGDAGVRFQALCSAFAGFFSTGSLWSVRGDLTDRLLATATLDQHTINVAATVPLIMASPDLIYFLPDGIVVRQGGHGYRYRYADVDIAAEPLSWVERFAVPADAVQVGSTFQHLTKDGSPDRRFADNPALPICAYQKVTLSFAGEFTRILIQSAARDPAPLVAAIGAMASPTSALPQP